MLLCGFIIFYITHLFKWYSGDVEPKFAAESAYAQRDFDAAEEHYRNALAITRGKTASVKRDLIEGLCRTLLKLDKHTEALKWANELVRNQEIHVVAPFMETFFFTLGLIHF